MKSIIAFLVIAFLPNFVSAQTAKPLPQLGKNSVEEVIAAMTPEEKVHFVTGTGMNMAMLPASMKDMKLDTLKITPAASSGPVVGQTMDKVAGAAGTTFAIPRLGIPSIVLADGPAGVRIQPIRNKDSSKTYYATAWPVGTLLASSWDTALVKKVGVAFGNEVHEYGIDVILAPALNIHRNPLGGRNFEYYSEDPLIAGSIAAAMVNGIQSNGVGTSIKHFAANNEETDRNTMNENISERALREIYLKGFKITVQQSHPWTVMSSYNKINGTYTSESHDLLTNILRKEWNYNGLVMSDWFGGKNAVAQMNAGNDLLMPGTKKQSADILDAVKNGSLDEKVLNKNVANILRLILKSPSFKKYNFSNAPDLKAHAAVSRMAAAEGMVLLKNNGNALPLNKNKNIALFGNASYALIAGGTGSGEVNTAYTFPFTKALNDAGFVTDKTMQSVYTNYIIEAKANSPKPKSFFEQRPPIKEMDVDQQTIEQQAKTADAAIITIGRNGGEGSDRKLDNDFYLSAEEKTLIKNVTDAFHAKNKKVIVVLNIGGVIEVASWRDMPDAILLAWQPGIEAGNAITDILSGKKNPSGKLATTFPMDYPDVPSAKNFPGKEFPDQAITGEFGMKQIPEDVTYEEGIYVGYRYYNTFNVKPAYEFGYGLSYTNFTYTNLKLNSTKFANKITATITIANSGKVAGKEVVQLYLSAPAKILDKPAEELKGFAKTRLLQPGESQTITFTINAEDLASYDTQSFSWIAEAGNYVVKIGSSSANIKQSVSFELPNEMVVEKDAQQLKPTIEINELKK
jgi:beta-glucosidase